MSPHPCALSVEASVRRTNASLVQQETTNLPSTSSTFLIGVSNKCCRCGCVKTSTFSILTWSSGFTVDKAHYASIALIFLLGLSFCMKRKFFNTLLRIFRVSI